MLSVDQCLEELNAPLEEGNEPTARRYTWDEAKALRDQAYCFLRALLQEEDTPETGNECNIDSRN